MGIDKRSSAEETVSYLQNSVINLCNNNLAFWKANLESAQTSKERINIILKSKIDTIKVIKIA